MRELACGAAVTAGSGGTAGTVTFSRPGRVLVTAIYQHNAAASAAMSTGATLNSTAMTGDNKTFVDAASTGNGASHTRILDVVAGDVLRLFMAGVGTSATQKCGFDIAYIL